MAPRMARPLALGLVLAAATWIHFASLSAPFFSDDYLFLDQVRGRSLFGALASGDPIGNYFRPVSRALWFWVLASLTGESARVFHAANLALFLGTIGLLERIARRLLPPAAALAGAALFAVHHAADVPVMWASGSQDLLAVLGAFAAIELHSAGRRSWAAAALALALLSKETVVLAPFVAVAVARGPRTSWRAALREAWPLFATLAAWALAWATTLSRRPAMGQEVQVRAADAPAAFAHLLQTAFGLEWPLAGIGGAFHVPPPLALGVAALGVVIVSLAARGKSPVGDREQSRPRSVAGRGSQRSTPRPAASPPATSHRHVLLAGTIWTIAGALPVIAVAGIWSAYYYLFSLGGVALIAGALVAARPAWVAVLPVLLVGFAAENARRLPEFATMRGAWTAQSHVNRHYFSRSMTLVGRYLGDLRRARPELPRASTLYFTGLPVSIGFQTADGPLVRWAYRDSSLRSYFLSSFRLEHAARGPLFFFQVETTGLAEITGRDSLIRCGLSLLMGDAPHIGRDMLILAWRAEPTSDNAYRLAWAEAASGRSDSTVAWLRRAGYEPDSGPIPEIQRAVALVAAGDTTGAITLMSGALRRHALNPWGHSLMADLYLTTGDMEHGMPEALAARILAPDESINWRRWGMVMADAGRDVAAVAALERYQALAGAAALGDTEINELLLSMRRRLPGGDVAQRELRRVQP